MPIEKTVRYEPGHECDLSTHVNLNLTCWQKKVNTSDRVFTHCSSFSSILSFLFHCQNSASLTFSKPVKAAERSQAVAKVLQQRPLPPTPLPPSEAHSLFRFTSLFTPASERKKQLARMNKEILQDNWS